MKRRNFIAAVVAAVAAPVTPVATAAPASTQIFHFTGEMQWEREHRKFVNNSMYGKVGRGMTTCMYAVDEFGFVPNV